MEQNTKKSSIGGLVGQLSGGKIENSTSDGKIIINGEVSDVGGLVGKMENGEIRNSKSNVEIQFNSETLFVDLKNTLEKIKDVDRQNELIELTNQMESSKGTASFGEHYKKFISSAADYMTLIVPFLPRLTELLK